MNRPSLHTCLLVTCLLANRAVLPATGRGGGPLRERGVTVHPFPSTRRLVTAGTRAGRRIVPMHGLFDVDISVARRLLAESTPPLSLTAFVVASIGRAAAAHPQVHAYRDWRGRLVEHRHVDVQTLVEVSTSSGPFGLVHVVRDADVRSVAEISAELRSVKTDPTATTTGRLLSAVAPTAGRIPGLYRLMYAVMARSRRAHLAIGTVHDGGGSDHARPGAHVASGWRAATGAYSKTMRAVTRPDSTSAIAAFTSSSSRDSATTRVQPAACSAKTSTRSCRVPTIDPMIVIPLMTVSKGGRSLLRRRQASRRRRAGHLA